MDFYSVCEALEGCYSLEAKPGAPTYYSIDHASFYCSPCYKSAVQDPKRLYMQFRKTHIITKRTLPISCARCGCHEIYVIHKEINKAETSHVVVGEKEWRA